MTNYEKLIEVADSINALINIVKEENADIEQQIKASREEKYEHIYSVLKEALDVIEKCGLKDQTFEVMTNIYGIDQYYPRTAAIVFTYGIIYVGEYYIGSQDVARTIRIGSKLSYMNYREHTTWFYKFIEMWDERTEKFISDCLIRVITEKLQSIAKETAAKNKELNEKINLY